MSTKIKTKPGLKFNAYAIISRAVEDGARWGVNHAHKHTDSPNIDLIVEHVSLDIMNALCEVVDFGD